MNPGNWLHTARIACLRSGFLLLGLLPVFASIGIALWHFWGERSHCEQQLSAILGEIATVEAISHPTPQQSHFSEFRLHDGLEHDAFLARSGDVTATKGPGGLLLRLDDVTIQAEYLPRLWNLLRQRILGQRSLVSPSLTLVLSEIQIRDQGGVQTLREVRVRAYPQSNGTRAVVSFRLGNNPDASPVQIRFFRPHDPTQDHTDLELICESTPLPCTLLGWQSLTPPPLGAQATFCGRAFHRRAAGEEETEYIGTVQGIDTRPWMAVDRNMNRSTTVRITSRKALLRAGHLVELDCRLDAGPGRIRHAAVLELCHQWHMKWTPDPPELDSEGCARFDQLGIELRYANDRLTLAGGIPQRVGILALAAEKPILMLPEPGTFSTLPTARVARTLEELVRVLPLAR